jgi:hypothetical protein
MVVLCFTITTLFYFQRNTTKQLTIRQHDGPRQKHPLILAYTTEYFEGTTCVFQMRAECECRNVRWERRHDVHMSVTMWIHKRPKSDKWSRCGHHTSTGYRLLDTPRSHSSSATVRVLHTRITAQHRLLARKWCTHIEKMLKIQGVSEMMMTFYLVICSNFLN